MSSGFGIKRGQYIRGQSGPARPTVKYWLLKEQLQRRHIAIIDFAKALGVTPGVLSGSKAVFPMEKVDRLIELLNNWDGPRRPKVRNERLVQPSPVTREMLVTGSEGT